LAGLRKKIKRKNQKEKSKGNIERNEGIICSSAGLSLLITSTTKEI